jgi:hypothetical protein
MTVDIGGFKQETRRTAIAILGALIMLFSHAVEGQEKLRTGAIFQVKHKGIIACASEDVLRELTEQLANVTPPPDLQSKLNEMNCSMIAEDLDWRVAETHGDTVRAQLILPPSPSRMAMPIMFFFISEVRLKH